MRRYQTKPYRMILEYLETIPGKHITAQEIAAHFADIGEPIALATVYRQIERLCEEGLLSRYFAEGTESACYEFYDRRKSCIRPVCFHCKCDVCGALIHLHCDELAGIRDHLQSEHGFALNPYKTVFYGTCAACLEKALRGEDTQEDDDHGTDHMPGTDARV